MGFQISRYNPGQTRVKNERKFEGILSPALVSLNPETPAGIRIVRNPYAVGLLQGPMLHSKDLGPTRRA